MDSIIAALIQLYKEFLQFFRPWTILADYERGVLLRFGKRHKRKRGKWRKSMVVGPGWIPHWPLHIETLESTNVVFETGEAADLVCHASDGTPIVAHAVAGYSISNPEKFLLEVEDAGDAVLDALGGVVTEAIRRKLPHEILYDPNFGEECRRLISRRFHRFGVRLESLYFHKLYKPNLKDGLVSVNQA